MDQQLCPAQGKTEHPPAWGPAFCMRGAERGGAPRHCHEREGSSTQRKHWVTVPRRRVLRGYLVLTPFMMREQTQRRGLSGLQSQGGQWPGWNENPGLLTFSPVFTRLPGLLLFTIPWPSSESGHDDLRNVDKCPIHQTLSKNFTLGFNQFGFYNSCFLPQLIFSVHSLNNLLLKTGEVTPAAGTVTWSCSFLFHLGWPSWPLVDCDGSQGKDAAVHRLSSRKREKGGEDGNSEGSGFGGEDKEGDWPGEEREGRGGGVLRGRGEETVGPQCSTECLSHPCVLSTED